MKRQAGRKFDIDSFRETLLLSKEATILWQQVLKTAKTSPAPSHFLTAPFTWVQSSCCVERRTQEIITRHCLMNSAKMFQKKQASLKMNNAEFSGMVCRSGERIECLSDLFIENKTSVVASTYCNSWVFDDFDERNPFESSALAYTKIFINRSENAKMKMLKEWLEEFNCDGIIFHDSKTCFNNSNAKFGLPQRLKEESGIPYLIIEGDLCDLRFFSEGQSITKIETFIEQLENQSGTAQRRKDRMVLK